VAPSPEDLLRPLERRGVRLELEPFRALLRRLGEPQRGFPSVLVAGTNGKGSCAALLAAALGGAGYRTGLYTSPHLEQARERVRVDGRAVSETALVAAVERVLKAAPEEPTWFEAATAAAFVILADQAVEIGVVEVGLGGRLDATNVVEPTVSVITPVALDHQDLLGQTLAAIAAEKAGVLRAGRAAVAWTASEPVRLVLEREAASLGARLRQLPAAVRWQLTHREGHAPRLELVVSGGGRHLLEPPLAGEHQLENLALAVVAAEELARAGFTRLDAPAVARGIRTCRWPGRLEEVLLPGGKIVLLDAAHNADGAARLASHLLSSAPCYDLLFGALADKDAAAMLRQVAPAADRVVLTAPPSPRARSPRQLASGLPSARLVIADEPTAALEQALAGASPVLVVTGSLFLVGSVRRELYRRFGAPEPAAEVAVWERS
jgi:dihydrofolate synthase / folylpolyglutamate synthase